MISPDAIRGYIDLIVLSLVRAEPSYAYALAQLVSRTTGDAYAIKQTTLYSALKRLENAALLESFPGTSGSGKPRRYYRITDAGLAYLTEKISEWQDTKFIVDRFVEGTTQ